MFHPNSRRKWIALALTFLLFAITFFLGERRGRTHPEFGRIYQTYFDETPRGFGKVTRGALHYLFNDVAGAMRLGSTMIFWSMASNSRSPKTGYLYFGDRPQHKWEFAPCSRSSLDDVTHDDLVGQFYGKQDPTGKAVFGDSWRTNSLYVTEGQVLFARPVSDPSVVYVLRLAKQGGDVNSGSILIEYVEIRNYGRPESDLSLDGKE